MLLMQKTSPLINSNETLKSIHNGKKIKNLGERNCRTGNIIYIARCKIYDDIYIGSTDLELRERFNKHRYDAKNRPDNNKLADHIHKYHHNFGKGKRIMGTQIYLFIGHKSTYRIASNVELKQYRRELNEAFTHLTAKYRELLFNLPVRKFPVYVSEIT